MVAHPKMPIAQRIASVQAEIATAAKLAQRRPEDIQLLAVSKRQSVERIRAAYNAGVRDFGENYMQGLEEHAEHFGPDVRWHFIGQLQSKKAKRVAWVHRIHSVDSLKLAQLLGKAATREDSGIDKVHCLINVNISQQDSKSGVAPDALEALLLQTATVDGLHVHGLMCIPSPQEPAQQAFARLRELRDQMTHSTDAQLPELSMGMSNSYKEAIAEGATIVRVGTALFGPREEEEV